MNAFYQAQSGAIVIGEHEEVGPGASGHEELYVVVEGAATFTVDGEETEAPRGTAIFVRPGTKRSARATEDGTIVLVVGGTPGEAWTPSPGESMGGFFGRYRDKDYEGALAILRTALEAHPGNALILYNIACMEACLGNGEAALEPLAESVAAWPKFKQQAAEDEDFTRCATTRASRSSSPRRARASDADDDLAARVPLAEVAESVGDLAQLVALLDDRPDLARFQELPDDVQVGPVELREEEAGRPARDRRCEPHPGEIAERAQEAALPVAPARMSFPSGVKMRLHFDQERRPPTCMITSKRRPLRLTSSFV